MSWGVDIEITHPDGYVTTIEVVDGHTYNLTPMWRKAINLPTFQSTRDMDGRTCADFAPALARGLLDAGSKSSEYRELDPPNGWGDYDGFLEILVRFTRLAYEHPTGVLRWNG